jgi:PhnB protein
MSFPTTPAGYHSITRYLTIKEAAAAIERYKKVFDAREVMRIDMYPNAIGHAVIKIAESHVMMSDEFPEMGISSPHTFGGKGGYLMNCAPNCGTMIAPAVAADATVAHAAESPFYGDRSGQIEDSFGDRSGMDTHIEGVSTDGVNRRMTAMMGGQ